MKLQLKGALADIAGDFFDCPRTSPDEGGYQLIVMVVAMIKTTILLIIT